MPEQLDVSFQTVIGLYLVAGPLAGLLVGVLLPFTIERHGAVVVGGLAAVPLYWGAGFLLGIIDPVLHTVASFVVGGAAGYYWWSPVPLSNEGLGNSVEDGSVDGGPATHGFNAGDTGVD